MLQIIRQDALAALGAALIASACSASYPAQPSGPVPVVALKVQYSFPVRQLVVGSSASLIAYTVDADGMYDGMAPGVAWFSSNPAVLRLNGSSILAVGPGTATVTAVFQGFTDSVTLPVVPVITFPNLFIDAPSGLKVGQSIGLRAFVQTSSFNTQEVTTLATWRSSDPAVVVMNGKNLTAVAPGNVEISVSYNNLTSWVRLSIPPRQRS
jgi:hypothetical protein